MPPPYTHMPTEGRYPSLTLRPAPNPTDTQPPTYLNTPNPFLATQRLRSLAFTPPPCTHLPAPHPLATTPPTWCHPRGFRSLTLTQPTPVLAPRIIPGLHHHPTPLGRAPTHTHAVSLLLSAPCHHMHTHCHHPTQRPRHDHCPQGARPPPQRGPPATPPRGSNQTRCRNQAE